MPTICDLSHPKTLLSCIMVFTRLRRFYLAIVDPQQVESITPGKRLGVQLYAHSRDPTSQLGLGPDVRFRMLDRPQMMRESHKYRLEPWDRPIAPERVY